MKRFLLSVMLSVMGISSFFYFYGMSAFKSNGHSIRIPVRFFPAPVMEIQIEGKKYALEIDLGTHAMSLRKEVLDVIKNKESKGIYESFDVKKRNYLHNVFIIPVVEIGGVEFTTIPTKEESIDFLTSGNKIWTSGKIDCETKKVLSDLHGRIGKSLFGVCTCYFDFPHSTLYLAENITELQKIKACSVGKFLEIPLVVNENGAVISIETDVGKRNFLLDTGAFKSIFKESLVSKALANEFLPDKWVFKSKKFMIGEHNFGAWDLILFEFSDLLIDIDGILGVDFFKEYAICLDFQNKKAYVQPPKEKWKRRMFLF